MSRFGPPLAGEPRHAVHNVAAKCGQDRGEYEPHVDDPVLGCVCDHPRVGTKSSGAPAGIRRSRSTLPLNSARIREKCANVHECRYLASYGSRSLGSTIKLMGKEKRER